MRNRHVTGSLFVAALVISLLSPVALGGPATADEPVIPPGCTGMTGTEENHASIRLQVDQPAADAQVAVDEHGKIPIGGILHKQATMLDVADGQVTATDFTLGPPPEGVAAWASSWTTSLRPPHLGANTVCARATRDPKRSARILRSFTVVDLIPPSAVPGLAVGAITATSAKATWGDATDNYGLAGYGVSVDGGPVQRTTVATHSYTITGLAPSSHHTVSVVAIDLAGNLSTPSTTSFTTTARPPPPSTDLTFAAEQGAATAAWHPFLPTDVTYRAFLDDRLVDEFPLDRFCVDATGNPANPCTAQDAIKYPIAPLDEQTPYTFRFEAVRADGTPGRSLSGSFTTAAVPRAVPPAITERIASEGSQCAGMGGDLYVSPTTRGRVPVPAGSTQLFEGCHSVPNSSCLDAFLPPSGAKLVNCADDMTRLLLALAPANRGPVLSSVANVVDYAVPPVPGQTLLVEPITLCTQGACAVIVATVEETAVVAAAPPAVGLITTILAVAGAVVVGILVGIALGTLLAIIFQSEASIAGLIEYPIHFDTNFDTFDNWGANHGVFFNSLKVYAETIKTTKQLADKWDLPFAWNDGEDGNLKRIITAACAAQAGNPSGSTTCGNGFAVYVPGALNYKFRPMPETGAHIVNAMGGGGYPQPPTRTVWLYPGRSQGGAAATNAGYSRGWFDTLAFKPNRCNPRPLGRSVCDEFPFWVTDQAVNLSGMVADLEPVPGAEASPQGNDISGFYRECDVDDNERFVVLPVKPWVAANGPSFGFRVTPGGTSMCLTPSPAVP